MKRGSEVKQTENRERQTTERQRGREKQRERG